MGSWYSNLNFQRGIKVLEKLLEYVTYGLSNKEINYINSNQKELSYEYALQYGLCSALLEKNNDKIHKLISKLEELSNKTYEVKKSHFLLQLIVKIMNVMIKYII